LVRSQRRLAEKMLRRDGKHLGETGTAYRMKDRIGEIVTRFNALRGKERSRPAP